MNEITNLLNKLKFKYRYTFQSYLNKLNHIYQPEDIEHEVLIKLYTKFAEGNIDMTNLENYLFITYRNFVIQASQKLSNTKHHIDDEMFLELKYDAPTVNELDDIQLNKLNMIKSVLRPNEYNDLIEYYDKFYLDGETNNDTYDRRLTKYRMKTRKRLNITYK